MRACFVGLINAHLFCRRAAFYEIGFVAVHIERLRLPRRATGEEQGEYEGGEGFHVCSPNLRLRRERVFLFEVIPYL
jgi:hypothetical protein